MPMAEFTFNVGPDRDEFETGFLWSVLDVFFQHPSVNVQGLRTINCYSFSYNFQPCTVIYNVTIMQCAGCQLYSYLCIYFFHSILRIVRYDTIYMN